MRQELATLLMSVQFLKEENPGRKIAEIQGQLATVSLGPQEGTCICLPKLRGLGDSVVVGASGQQQSMSTHDWSCV